MKLLILTLIYSFIFINIAESKIGQQPISTNSSYKTLVEKTNKKAKRSKRLKKKALKKASFKKIKKQKETHDISGRTLGYLIGAGIIFLAGMIGFIYLLTIGAAVNTFLICGVFMLAGLIFFLIVLLIWMKKNDLLGPRNFKKMHPSPLRELEER